MSKLFKSILTALFIFPLIFSSFPLNKAQAYVYENDQYCDNDDIANVDGYWLIKTHEPLMQSFRPHKNRLTSIMLAIQGGADVNAEITLYLAKVGAGVVATKVATTQTALASWVEFTFPTPITMDTTKDYIIEITTPSTTANWIVSNTPCYAEGIAYVDATESENQDFGFVTSGYNVVAAETVAAPTGFQAYYMKDGNRNKLTWVKSTTAGVSGYKIYRSLNKTSGFVQIAKVIGANTEKYNDYSGIVPDTFYYYIQAYKGDTKSQPTATKTVVVPEPTVETEDVETPTTLPNISEVDDDKNTVVDQIKEDIKTEGIISTTFISKLFGEYLPFSIAIISCVLLGIILLTVFIVGRSKKSVTKRR